jgi:hypothetical protein
VLQSLLAEAYWKADKPELARNTARRAISLDEINARAGHTDKRLPQQRIALIQQILVDNSN